MQMKTQFLIFICYIIFFCFSYSFSATWNNEVLALLSIKSGLLDPLNTLQDWKLDSPHCNWTRIKCNSAGTVENLDLSHKNLNGMVSNDIQRLQYLTSLIYPMTSNNANLIHPCLSIDKVQINLC
ncbi:unnamed protein product [Lathyrus sativus]|nr:unnamed protein product [Lathyrus sativus]